jgi:hypothetical protein
MVIGGSRFHTEGEHWKVAGRPIVRPLDLPPLGAKFWDVVATHLWEMALASYADWEELRVLATTYSDWMTTHSNKARQEFERLCEGFCLEPATKQGPLSKFGIQVRTNPTLEPYSIPQPLAIEEE